MTTDLQSAEAVRVRCLEVCSRVTAGDGQAFTIDRSCLPACADRVAQVTLERYPDLAIPLHARWRHFVFDGVDRFTALAAQFPDDPLERARIMVDLVIPSVLLDAGAGSAWSYSDAQSGARFARSEGLALASLEAFAAGLFSLRTHQPWRCDGFKLSTLTDAMLAGAFQVRDDNPLNGMRGRAQVLRALGRAMHRDSDRFGVQGGRLGHLVDYLQRGPGKNGQLTASALLREVLQALAPIWPKRAVNDHAPPGDIWRYPGLPGDGLVPFHKLSQWLSLSLIEPLALAGIEVSELNGLSALAEYRNGGLLIDSRVLVANDPALIGRTLAADDPAIVEWRALTVALFDELAPLVRDRLGLDATALPLPALLEGGTWAAGRQLAQDLRDGRPPIELASDGSVF
ncbi:MAG: DUF1688 family protein [Geminicoccaceae bacterium]